MKTKKDKLTLVLFLAPVLLFLIIFRLFPISKSLLSSFQTITYGGGENVKWVGLENYRFIFTDPTFWKSLLVTLKFAAIINPLQIITAFIFALLVNRKIKGIGFFRSMFFLPITVSLAVACTIWALLLNPNSGLLNSLIAALNIPPQPFLTSSKQALWSIILIASWRGVGYWMMFLLAGLQQIPQHIYNAAKIDGANKLQILFNITIPLMKRTLAFVIIADTTINFLMFVPMYTLTKGGPNLSTNVLMYEAYKNMFIYGDRGIASAIIMIILIIIVIIVSLEFKVLKEKQ